MNYLLWTFFLDFLAIMWRPCCSLLNKPILTRYNTQLVRRASSNSNCALKTGLVIERQSDRLLVELTDETLCSKDLFLCNQIKALQSKTIVAGDVVEVSVERDESSRIISSTVMKLSDRKNVIERPSPGSNEKKIKMKTMAANVDQMIIVTSPKPKVSYISIDELIVASYALKIPEVLFVANKCDLEEFSSFMKEMAIYSSLGYDMIEYSTRDTSVSYSQRLLQHLHGKTSIFVGQSGVGKSSLINSLIPSAEAVEGELVERTEMGAHTTSNSHVYRLQDDANIIDSPGIREFRLWHVDLQIIRNGFIEIAEIGQHCKYRGCWHEPKAKGCAVLDAVEQKKISPQRYKNYLALLAQKPLR